jgi:hypothetical protein
MIVFGQKRRKTARRNRFPLSGENQEKLRTMDDKNAPAPDIKNSSSRDPKIIIDCVSVIIESSSHSLRGYAESCYVVAVKRRTSTTYLHEEATPYGSATN